MKTYLFMTIALFGWVWQGYAQAPAAPLRLDPDLIAFFTGHWAGKGEFANGAPIAAEVTFEPSLDSAWLLYEHRDVPPGGYKATSMWGVDEAARTFVGFTFDNFHGHRQWKSDGWIEGRLVLSTGSAGTMREHFIYARMSATQFKMTYEVSGDGINWRMGDWLVFTRE